eukprot:scaffold23830_cov92-Isochrysis_galbana.AAC.1
MRSCGQAVKKCSLVLYLVLYLGPLRVPVTSPGVREVLRDEAVEFVVLLFRHVAFALRPDGLRVDTLRMSNNKTKQNKNPTRTPLPARKEEERRTTPGAVLAACRGCEPRRLGVGLDGVTGGEARLGGLEVENDLRG